jgi:uncharacterized membrane protein
MENPWHLKLMAAVYVLAGLNHYAKPGIYKRIIPPYIPKPHLINYIVGILELILGMGLLYEHTRIISAWGIIALLILVFPSNLYMVREKKARLGMPKWLLVMRLPLQLALILWAYSYT